MTTRRRFLKTTALASAGVLGSRLVPHGRLLARSGSAATSLRIPRTLKSGVLRGAPTTAQIFDGPATPVYGLNGTYLGPTIEIDRGEEFAVRMENGLPDEDLILHWHGMLVPSEMDGHPHQAVGPGEFYDYRYTVDQRAGTYWYHPHTHEITGPQTYKGLAGLYIVHDEEERGLPLPQGEYDIPLIVQDKRVSENNELIYDLTPIEIMRGWQGDTILTNGLPEAELDVERTRYRFRILNASNARVFKIALSDDRPFHLIATGGGLLQSPVELDSLFLPPADRVEILVDFSGEQEGTTIDLLSAEFFEEFQPGSRQGNPARLLRCNVRAAGPTPPSLPQSLSSITPWIAEDALRTRSFRLHHFEGKHAINDLIFSPMRIDFRVPQNELEIWEFTNPTQILHPMHVHGVQFQVLDRNNRTDQVWPEDAGWNDMVLLLPTSSVRVLIRFTAHPGMFMLHCHNLEHEDDGMMLNFMVEKETSVGRGSEVESDLIVRSDGGDALQARFAPAARERSLVVSDIRGRLVARSTVRPGATELRIPLRDQPSGPLFVTLEHESAKILMP